MTIGLSKLQIQKKLNEVFLTELSPPVGVLSQEKISNAIAEIITENNRQIEKHIENEIRKLNNNIWR